jgi:glycosyltransferase involved in cell wall biosynthesis
MNKPVYSYIVPIYNDGYLARDFCREFATVFAQAFPETPLREVVELIFVNDGSTDSSINLLKDLLPERDFLRVIDLSRNFGQHIAISCGFSEARGTFVGRTNVDMQDPLSEIPRFIEAIQDPNIDLVIGTYDERQSRNSDKITAYFFFRFFNWLSGQTIPQNTSSLRLMSRRYIDTYNSLTEKTRFPQGIDSWLGFNHQYISIGHNERADKKSSYTWRSRLKIALDASLSFSDRPLGLIFAAGVAFMIFAVLFSAYLIGWRLLSDDPLPGYASLVLFFLLFSGFQNICLGIIAQYIGKVLQEVQNRPLYVIKDRYEGGAKANGFGQA